MNLKRNNYPNLIPNLIEEGRIKEIGIRGGDDCAIITTTINGTFQSNWRGTSGAKIYIDPGDGGAVESITLIDPDTDVAWNHVYSGGTHMIKISGDTNEVISFDIRENDITNIDLANRFLKLYDFLAHNQNINSINGLKTTNSLHNLYLQNNNINSLFFLENVEVTNRLYLFTNNIVNISVIASRTVVPNYLYMYSNTINYPLTGLSWFTATGGTFYINSCDLDAAEVDQCITDLAGIEGAGWSGTTTNLAGTNAARTSASDDDVYDFVVVKGNSLTINE